MLRYCYCSFYEEEFPISCWARPIVFSTHKEFRYIAVHRPKIEFFCDGSIYIFPSNRTEK